VLAGTGLMGTCELRISSQWGRPRGRLPRTLSRPLGEREGGGNGTRRANQGRGEELTNKTIVNNYQINVMTISKYKHYFMVETVPITQFKI
jgi:hypothetical protein